MIWEDRRHMGIKPDFEAVTAAGRYFIETRGPRQPVRWWRVGADMAIDAASVDKAKAEALADFMERTK
jgi:hypothetical protein